MQGGDFEEVAEANHEKACISRAPGRGKMGREIESEREREREIERDNNAPRKRNERGTQLSKLTRVEF